MRKKNEKMILKYVNFNNSCKWPSRFVWKEENGWIWGVSDKLTSNAKLGAGRMVVSEIKPRKTKEETIFESIMLRGERKDINIIFLSFYFWRFQTADRLQD